MFTTKKNVFVLNSKDFKNDGESLEKIRQVFAEDTTEVSVTVVEDAADIPNNPGSEVVTVGKFSEAQRLKSSYELSQCSHTWIGVVEDNDLSDEVLDSSDPRQRSSSETFVSMVMDKAHGDKRSSLPDNCIVALTSWGDDHKDMPDHIKGENGRKIYPRKGVIEEVMVEPHLPEKATNFATPPGKKRKRVSKAKPYSFFSVENASQLVYYATSGAFSCAVGLAIRGILNSSLKSNVSKEAIDASAAVITSVMFIILSGVLDNILDSFCPSEESQKSTSPRNKT